MLHHRYRLAVAMASWLWMVSFCEAQTTVYNSNGFEGFAVDTLSPQDNWQTTDFNQLFGSTPAGVVQSSTTFSGSRAVQVIGPNLFDDGGFAGQTFWYQDRTASPFNPVANGTPVVRTTWRQMLQGTQGNTAQMPFAGVYFEGFNAANQQQVITTVFIDNAERLTAMTTSGNFFSSATLPNIFNNWQNLQVDLNFSTQRFTVFLNGVAVSPLINLPFRNSLGATNRLVEFGFEASFLSGSGVPPTNDNFYDDYLVMAFAVPEPTTYALIGLGIVSAAGAWNYRRRKLAQASNADVEEAL